MYFESLINESFSDFYSDELKRFEETQDENLQQDARNYLDKIEHWIKNTTLNHLEELYGDAWNLVISDIESDASKRAIDEVARKFQQENKRVKIDWTDMLFIKDYINISQKFWNKLPGEGIEHDEQKFKRLFEKISIDLDKRYIDSGNTYFKLGTVSNKESGIKWMKQINSLRNTVAHIATKSFGVNKEEVEFLKTVHNTITRKQT